MKPRLTILGSGTCVPRLERSSAGYMLETGSSLVLLDMGPGTIRRLLETGKSTDNVTHICLSHFHPDHSADLIPFLFATKYGGSRRRQPVQLFGGPGFELFLKALQAAYGPWLSNSRELWSINELDPARGPIGLPDFTLRFAQVCHRPESLAFRIETRDGFCLVYGGDSDYCRNLVEIAMGADLLVCESSMPDGQKVDGHLTPSLAGRVATSAAVAKLVLTHFYPACDAVDIAKQCRATYKGPLVLAQDLLTVEPEA